MSFKIKGKLTAPLRMRAVPGTQQKDGADAVKARRLASLEYIGERAAHPKRWIIDEFIFEKTMVTTNSQDEHVRTPARYLVLGSTGYAGVESTSWIDDKLPNIVDFDVVLVDVPALTEERLAAVNWQRFKTIREQLVRFLDSGGNLIVITNQRISHKRPNSYPEYLDNYGWSPLSIGIQPEKGQSIVKKLDDFADYLDLMQEWDYYVFIPRDCLTHELSNFYGSTYDTNYKIPVSPIVVNRYDKVLAGRYSIEIRHQRTKSSGYSEYKEYPSTPDTVTGELVLLPSISGLDNREAVSIVLKHITGKPQLSNPPEWCDTLIIPGVPELIKQSQDRKNHIDTLLKEIGEIENKIQQLNNFKRLLFGSGAELENVVAASFTTLGGSITPAKYSQEEFILAFRGREYLVEVKGVSKSIALSHLRQLNDYLLKYQEDTGHMCKGILFGNAWRALRPSERGTNDKPIFPENLIKRAEQWDIALVSSTAFYSAFIEYLKNGNGDSLLISIVDQKGVVQFPQHS